MKLLYFVSKNRDGHKMQSVFHIFKVKKYFCKVTKLYLQKKYGNTGAPRYSRKCNSVVYCKAAGWLASEGAGAALWLDGTDSAGAVPVCASDEGACVVLSCEAAVVERAEEV